MRYIYRRKNLLCGLIALFSSVILPENLRAQLNYQIETEGKVSGTGQTPFWLVNNRQGLATLEKENAYLRAGVFREMRDSSLWDYRFGLDVAEGYGYPSRFIVQQMYGDVRYKKAVLSVGSKERWGMLKNHELSSGGMSWSGNARPIPQVRLETDGFVTFPWLLHRQLKVNGSISYGWFTDEAFIRRKLGSSTDNVLYHGKSLILQYDIPEKPWSATLGMESHAQFGGERKDLRQYFMVLIPSQGDGNSSAGDQLYMFGSSRGSWHLNISYHPKGYEWKAYLENFFDDFSGVVKQNGFDGLWGLEYRRTGLQKGITGVVLEYLQTTNQSGPVNWVLHDHPGTDLKIEAPTGCDNYYNGAYNSGWTHWGMVNGNPLLSSPIYGKNGVTGIFNSRVKALHLGVSGELSRDWSGRILTTYTRGWGTYGSPFPEISRDYVSLLEVCYAPRYLKQWQFTLSGAMDRGDLYGNNSGFALKIRYVR